ncbi:MAG: ABC-F family ATP-binding cassette domain-containing protein [Spirochaetia bacterium]|nr:ABC-F family ATP-binding cassette domain-containing protein [Spirochaetia bacterium]
MITITNLKLQFSGDPLFENVNLQLNPRNRYGIVGSNGSGKSTFLKILTDEEHNFSGTVNVPKEIKVGFMKQNQFLYEDDRIVDVVISGNEVLYNALKKKRAFLNTHHDNLTKSDEEEIGHIEETIYNNDGYSAEARACRILDGLGIYSNRHFEPMKSLSGGYKLRVLLARVLFQNPDVLLLDEPTNHLDIVSISWLENYLATKYRGALLVISHDRHFINRISTHILDVDYRTITHYTGNYDDFVEAKTLAMEQKLKEVQSLEKKVEQLQGFVDRFKAKASKARQAQSRQKQIEKIDIPDIAKTSRRYPDFKLEQERPSGREVLKVENLSKAYGDKTILNSISFELERGEKVAIIGPNGAGKSTLMKALAGAIKGDSGKIMWGAEAKISYFAQEHHEVVSGKESALQWLTHNSAPTTPAQIRSILGAILFSKDEADKSVSNLSGGELARLNLGKIISEKPNVLLLDEPTNHLDMECIASLEDALLNFKGTVIFVSHDKSFVSNIAQSIFEISEDGLRKFSGDYEEFLENFGTDYLNRFVVKKQKTDKGNEETSAIGKGGNQYELRKEKKSMRNKLQTSTKKLESTIHSLEKQLEDIEAVFASPEYFNQKSQDEISSLQKEKENTRKLLDESILEWEDQLAKLEELNKELG